MDMSLYLKLTLRHAVERLLKPSSQPPTGRLADIRIGEHTRVECGHSPNCINALYKYRTVSMYTRYLQGKPRLLSLSLLTSPFTCP